jgi:lysophospholipase L1-like esterase
LAVVWRGFGRLMAAAALGCLIVLLVTSAVATVGPAPGTGGSRPSSLQAVGAPGGAQEDGRQGTSQTECEQRLQSDRRPGVPAVVIVGASITAGVGAEDPAGSWAVLLARQLRWNAFVYGVPGAGYVHPGLGRKGPAAAEIARADLRALRPSLVIVQAGHDDWRVPPDLERLRVEQTVATIKAEAPQARIALLTVFAGRSRPRAIYQTDQAIVAGAGAADPQVIIMDPLASGWRFPHAPDGLHPSPRGDAWIAGKVADILRQHGVNPAPAGRGAVLCTIAIRAQAAPVKALNRPAPRPAVDAPRLPYLVSRTG